MPLPEAKQLLSSVQREIVAGQADSQCCCGRVAMRIQHAAQTASGWPADDPSRTQAKTMIVEEVERLRWRIWNGKAKNARRSIDRVRKVMHV